MGTYVSEFRKHLELEEKNNMVLKDFMRLIKESYGTYKFMDKCCDDIKNFIDSEFAIKRPDMLVFDKCYDGMFFKRIKINFSIFYTKDDTIDMYGNYLPSVTTIDKNDGKIKVLRISMNLFVPENDYGFGHDVSSMISHEILLAYEDCDRKMKGGGIQSSLISDKYFKNFSGKKDNPIIQDLANVIYLLTDKEKRANIAMCCREIKNNREKIEDLNTLESVVYSTHAWQLYNDVCNFVDFLSSTDVGDCENLILKYWNENTNHPVKNYLDVVKYIKNDVSKYRSIFLHKVASYAFNIYESNFLGDNLMMHGVSARKINNLLKYL